MSSNKEEIFNKMFNTYSDAISDVLEARGLEQKWLVENIIREGQNFESLQQQMSRWLRNSKPISEGYQHRINNALDIFVNQESDGKWRVHSQEEKNENTKRNANHVNESMGAYEARKVEKDVSDTEREILLEYLQGQAESLLKGLRQLADLDRKRS